MKHFLKIFSFLSVSFLSFNIVLGNDEVDIEDIKGHWAEKEIKTLVNIGVIKGYADATFRPNQPVKRAEMLKMVISALQSYSPQTDPSGFDIYALSGVSFTDVLQGEWYIPYLRRGANVVQGYKDGTFRPEKPVTRAEAVVMLIKAAEIEQSEEADLPFNDLLAWQKPWIAPAYSLGVVKGYNLKQFRPNKPVTRAEAAVMLSRMYDVVVSRELMKEEEDEILEAEIIYSDSGFSPKTLTIKPDTTVIFKNQSDTSFRPASAVHPTHKVYPGSDIEKCGKDTPGGIFDACAEVKPGDQWSFNFSQIGTWKYHNHLNPKNTGTIVVE